MIREPTKAYDVLDTDRVYKIKIIKNNILSYTFTVHKSRGGAYFALQEPKLTAHGHVPRTYKAFQTELKRISRDGNFAIK